MMNHEAEAERATPFIYLGTVGACSCCEGYNYSKALSTEVVWHKPWVQGVGLSRIVMIYSGMLY